eukprot:m51a1_g4647 putative cysteine synthase (752) ;mRNA; r:7388-11069
MADWRQPTPDEALEHAVAVCREHGILLPTYAMLADPSLVPSSVTAELSHIGLWDVNPRNLFRITWHNEPREAGGVFGPVNFVEVPQAVTGVAARVLLLVGRWFPTGCHKVGASYGPLVRRLVTGAFDPTCQRALWPSTGNYCRGGAFNSALLHSPAIAVLPAQMSQERFDWLRAIGSEVFATPGCESSVKAVFDKNNELVREGHGRVVSLNQFSDFNNPLWHYNVTGPALEELFATQARPGQRLAGVHFTQGSGGTLAAADYLRKKFPLIKHVPWIINVRNLDAVVAIDDEVVMRTVRLFNEPAGRAYLAERGVGAAQIDALSLMGISSVANLVGACKMARYYEWTARDVVVSVCTDSMAMYGSRLAEMTAARGAYARDAAVADLEALRCAGGESVEELGHRARRRIHNLKYYTWVEQQGLSEAELRAQWDDYPEYWDARFGESARRDLDAKITEFNRRTGLAQKRTASDFTTDLVSAVQANNASKVRKLLERLASTVDREDERVEYPGWEEVPLDILFGAPSEAPEAPSAPGHPADTPPGPQKPAAAAVKPPEPAPEEERFEVGSQWVAWDIRDHALWHAAFSGSVEALSLLLDSGADIESPGSDGTTPLEAAAMNMHLGALAVLVERGADTGPLRNHRDTLRACARRAIAGYDGRAAEVALELCSKYGCLPESMLESVSDPEVAAVVGRYGESIAAGLAQGLAESIHQERRSVATAFLTGLHPRVGRDSAVWLIDCIVARIICLYAFPR